MSTPQTDDMLAQAAAGAADADAGNAFRVDIDGFEGPLHLLLDLARRQKVDLAHISILDLANQYLAFIREVQDRRMDLAADYLLMAAWLAFLKSKLLLPRETSDEDEPDGDALAGRLAFRLKRLEAMRVRTCGSLCGEHRWAGRVPARGARAAENPAAIDLDHHAL